MVSIMKKSRLAKILTTILLTIVVAGFMNISDAKADTYSSAEEAAAQSIVNTIANSSTKLYVVDQADILTDSEEKKLEALCKKASKNCETDIVIITMRTGKDYQDFDNYVDDILYNYYGYSGKSANPDAVVYAIDMVSRANGCRTAGKAQSDISQSVLDDIRISSGEELTDGDYYAGCKVFVKGIEKQLNNSFLYEFMLYWPIKLIIAAVIALISVLVMMGNSKTKVTVSGRTYANNGLRMHRQEDRFINTTVTTRRIESSSSSGGSRSGGGGGNSGGSRGHF